MQNYTPPWDRRAPARPIQHFTATLWRHHYASTGRAGGLSPAALHPCNPCHPWFIETKFLFTTEPIKTQRTTFPSTCNLQPATSHPLSPPSRVSLMLHFLALRQKYWYNPYFARKHKPYFACLTSSFSDNYILVENAKFVID